MTIYKIRERQRNISPWSNQYINRIDTDVADTNRIFSVYYTAIINFNNNLLFSKF